MTLWQENTIIITLRYKGARLRNTKYRHITSIQVMVDPRTRRHNNIMSQSILLIFLFKGV